MCLAKGLLPVLCLILFMSMNALFGASANKYEYDFNEPVTIVKAASKMLMNADYENMLNITELNEKKKTQETLDEIKGNNKLLDMLKKESDKIAGFEILTMEVFTNDIKNQMVIVSTRWMVKVGANGPKNPEDFVKIDPSADPSTLKQKKLESAVYVEYLLKKMDGKWKIISKKTK